MHKLEFNCKYCVLNGALCFVLISVCVQWLYKNMLISYTGYPRRKGQNFGRVFLMLKYTDITQQHLYPKLNGYGDNGQRKVWSSGGSTHCTLSADSVPHVCPRLQCQITEIPLTLLRQYSTMADYACHV